jgi:ATP-dependent Clp protease ATP-binding subunit ClpA
MARVIEEHLKKPLADEMLFGKLQKGGKAKVARTGDRLALTLRTR